MAPRHDASGPMDGARVMLPNPDRVVIDPRKIAEYVLNPRHDLGKHKARVFATALDIQSADADLLIGAIRAAAQSTPASRGKIDSHGQRYVLDFTMRHRGRTATVRTSWIVRQNEDFARFLSCYVL